MVGALIAIHFLEDGYDSASSRTYLAIKTPEPPWNIPMCPFFWRVSHELLFFKSIGERFSVEFTEFVDRQPSFTNW